jgi:diaminohydroxyphosphoribosylaminopyrimidine deaminase/5-amino-6-(5-phosphoribosylamino)uracil reductase
MLPSVFFPPQVIANWRTQRWSFLAEPQVGRQLDRPEAMRLAIQEAYKGLGRTSPNPLVGCVILDSQYRFLSKGHHVQFGGPHAEVNALHGLNEEQLRGAHVFVTLEPCAHEGKTPSCAKALARLPVKEVIFGLIDPNPLVAGQGAEILKAAGLHAGIFAENCPTASKETLAQIQQELEEVCEHFLYNFREKKVFVSLKVASSLDGQMALQSGESQWITDETSREVAQVLRAAHDAVLVGRGTIERDNPRLTLRHPQFQGLQKKVIVLDTQAKILNDSDQFQLFKEHDPKNLIFVVDPGILKQLPNPLGVTLLPVRENLNEFLTDLWSHGLRSVYIEGGARVLSSFLSQKAFQRLYVFQSPMILGAKGGKAWSEAVNISSMSGKILLQQQKVIPLGNDVLITGKLTK